MRDLIQELIPNAPKLGLYVQPYIPEDKLQNALADYGEAVGEEEVLALYDATLMGSAKDGALFTATRMVFQNNDLESPQVVAYADLVSVRVKRHLISGKRVLLGINPGRTTVEMVLDFSGKSKAAEPVAQFLNEAMIRGAADEMEARRAATIPPPLPTTAEGAAPSALMPPPLPAEEPTRAAHLEPPFPVPGVETDLEAVRAALDELQEQELLSAEDYYKLRKAVGLD